jgi:hypothetical protein
MLELQGQIGRAFMQLLYAIEMAAIGAISGAGGGAVIVRLLGDQWLERTKAGYTRELEQIKDGFQKEQKRIQAEVDRSLFVTRAHFETEYAAMKEVSEALAQVKIAFRALHPIDAHSQSTAANREEHVQRLENTNGNYFLKM